MKEEETKIYDCLLEPLKAMGYDLYEVRLSGGKNKTLSVTVDRVKPISLEDIVTVSEKVSEELDRLDPIKDPYTLDVSSLGAEKPIKLEALHEYVGQYVNIHLSHPFQGENILEGTLMDASEDTIHLKLRIKTAIKVIELPRGDVDKARLAIEL